METTTQSTFLGTLTRLLDEFVSPLRRRLSLTRAFWSATVWRSLEESLRQQIIFFLFLCHFLKIDRHLLERRSETGLGLRRTTGYLRTTRGFIPTPVWRITFFCFVDDEREDALI